MPNLALAHGRPQFEEHYGALYALTWTIIHGGALCVVATALVQGQGDAQHGHGRGSGVTRQKAAFSMFSWPLNHPWAWTHASPLGGTACEQCSYELCVPRLLYFSSMAACQR